MPGSTSSSSNRCLVATGMDETVAEGVVDTIAEALGGAEAVPLTNKQLVAPKARGELIARCNLESSEGR